MVDRPQERKVGEKPRKQNMKGGEEKKVMLQRIQIKFLLSAETIFSSTLTPAKSLNNIAARNYYTHLVRIPILKSSVQVFNQVTKDVRDKKMY